VVVKVLEIHLLRVEEMIFILVVVLKEESILVEVLVVQDQQQLEVADLVTFGHLIIPHMQVVAVLDKALLEDHRIVDMDQILEVERLGLLPANR
jgi:hypothetical protein